MVWLLPTCGGVARGTSGTDGSTGVGDAGGMGALASAEASAGITDEASSGSTDGSARSPEGSVGSPQASVDSGGLLEGSAGPCNYVSLPTRGAQVQLVSGTPMPGGGGAIGDGLYELDAAFVYGATSAGASIEARVHAIYISGLTWASVSYFDSAPTVRYNDEATLSGTSVSLRRRCGDAPAGILFGNQGTYTASDSQLILNFDAGPAFGNGTAVLRFVRSTGMDSGLAACIGTACSNSYDCCPDDAGIPPPSIHCGANGACELCNRNGLNDPCLGGSSPDDAQPPDCCAGLRCVNNRCVR
jgi:hypothetical protein